MTTAELALLARCARAVCAYCAHLSYRPAERDGDGGWHHRPLRGKGAEVYCDAALLWDEFDVEPAGIFTTEALLEQGRLAV